MVQLPRHIHLFLLLLGFGIGFHSLVTAQDNSYFVHQTESGTKEDLLAYMQESKVQGVSIAVYRGLKEDTFITLGYQDAAGKVPVDAETMFNAGSMGGSLLDFLALKAASQGRLDLDAPVLDYMKQWQFPRKGWMKKDPVTTRDLLLATRRYSVGYKSAGQEVGQPISTLLEELTGKGEGPALAVTKKKNKSGNYSYGDRLILQVILEDIYGMPITEVVQKEVFDPLEMQNSVFVPHLDVDQYPNSSVGFDSEGIVIPGGRWDYPVLVSGGLWTTPRDYAKFVAHIFQAANGKKNSMLTQDLARQATTVQEKQRCLIFNMNTDLFWGGASRGFYTNFSGKQENGTIVVVFTNSQLNWRFTNQVVGMCWDFTRR